MLPQFSQLQKVKILLQLPDYLIILSGRVLNRILLDWQILHNQKYMYI